MTKKISKRRKELLNKFNLKEIYSIKEGIGILNSLKSKNFDETVEIALNLNIDPRHSDQMIRSSVIMPHGTGKKIKIAVITKDSLFDEAKESGADLVGNSDLIEKIKSGIIDFDTLITTPDMMGMLGKVARILGPKGLMPNPKTGTITTNIKQSIKDIKSGKIDFKTDKKGNIHAGIGKISFGKKKIEENLNTFLKKINKLKPATAKGKYIISATLSLTMSPGVSLNTLEVLKIK